MILTIILNFIIFLGLESVEFIVFLITIVRIVDSYYFEIKKNLDIRYNNSRFLLLYELHPK